MEPGAPSGGQERWGRILLHTGKTLDELTRQRERLLSYQERHGDGLETYRQALAALRDRFPTAAALEAAQTAARAAQAEGAGEPPTLGARPTAEYDRWLRETVEGIPALRFGQRFATHEDARAWAERLRGVTTFAVDGSQLPPWRDASLPVALAQAGLFENPHMPPQPYIKDITVRLITPEELAGDEPEASDARAADDTGYSSRFVQLRRFELEVETVIARMEHHLRAAGDAGGGGPGRAAGRRLLRWQPDRLLRAESAAPLPRALRRRGAAAAGGLGALPRPAGGLH